MIRRVATMGQTSPEIIQEVEKGLEHRMASVMSQQFEKAGGVAAVAEILNVIDRATERSLLENLAQEDPDLVEEIRRLMFVFEDISQARQPRHPDAAEERRELAVGHGAEGRQRGTQGQDPRQHVEAGRRPAAARRWSTSGPVRASNVEQMQQQIVDIIRRLEDAGEITIHAGDEEERFIQ